MKISAYKEFEVFEPSDMYVFNLIMMVDFLMQFLNNLLLQSLIIFTGELTELYFYLANICNENRQMCLGLGNSKSMSSPCQQFGFNSQ